MTASWMLASTIITVLFALAAVMLEPVIALYRRIPLRTVWIGAAMLGLGASAIRLLPSRALPAAEIVSGTSLSQNDIVVSLSRNPAPTRQTRSPVAALGTRARELKIPTLTPGADRVAVLIWATCSAVLALVFLATARRIAGERREWTRTTVAGTRLLLSTEFGPAIVGLLRPEIVVPQWINSVDERSRRAIVAHEAEHLAARDPAVILAGLALVIAMPWNIGLWICWRGLRRTVELDCDARVLASGIQRAEYASVLLGAWQRARSSWLPSPAFAERASGIGKRVEHLMRPEPRRRAMRTLIGCASASALIFIACATPSEAQRGTSATSPYPLVIIDGVKHPELPPRFRFTGAVVPETTTAPFKIMYLGPMKIDSAANKLYPSEDDIALRQTIAAPASIAHFGPEAQYGATLYYTKKYRASGGAILFPAEGGEMARRADPSTPADVMSQRIFDNMFAGITMTPAQKAVAMPIIQEAQAAQSAITSGPVLAIWPKRMKILDDRDAALRALLTSDKDRTQFDIRAAEGHHVVTAQSVTDNMYINLFKYTALTMSSSAEADAHSIILAALNDDVALFNRAPTDLAGRIAIRRKRDAALRALLTSDADRAKFDAQAERTMKGELPSP